MTIYHYRFQIGDLTCVAITDFERQMQVDGIFSNRPPQERLQVLGDYQETGLPNAINVLYIDMGEQRVLVDSSVGGERTNLLARLDAIGVQSDDIDRVIITHGHGDHVGGLVDMSDGGLVFPNARYIANRAEWSYWAGEAQRNADTPNATIWRTLHGRIADRLELCEPGDELLPGIRSIAAYGHTPGQIALLIESAGERLLHIADVAHHPFQIQYTDWSPRFDSDPELAAQTRVAVFEQASRDSLLVMAYHFPMPGLGYVRGQQWEPVG